MSMCDERRANWSTVSSRFASKAHSIVFLANKKERARESMSSFHKPSDDAKTMCSIDCVHHLISISRRQIGQTLCLYLYLVALFAPTSRRLLRFGFISIRL